MVTTQDTKTVTVDGEEFPADAVLQAIDVVIGNGVIDPSTHQMTAENARRRTVMAS